MKAFNDLTTPQQQQPANDFGALLKEYAANYQNPDYAKMIEYNLAQLEPQKRSKEDTTLGKLLWNLTDIAEGYSAAHRANPGGAWWDSLAAGLEAPIKRQEKIKEKRKIGQKEIAKELQDLLEKQRKYDVDTKKAEAQIAKDQRSLQSADILDQLRMAQTQKALKGPASVDWMQRLLASNEIASNTRKHERQQQAFENNLNELPKLDELEVNLDRMTALVPKLSTGFGSGVKNFVGSAWNSESSQAAKEFENLKTSLFEPYTQIFKPMSNADTKIIKEMMAGGHMPEKTLYRVLNNMRRDLAAKKLHVLAQEEYMTKHGNLDNFETTFSKLLSAHPIQDSKTGQIKQSAISDIINKIRGEAPTTVKTEEGATNLPKTPNQVSYTNSHPELNLKSAQKPPKNQKITPEQVFAIIDKYKKMGASNKVIAEALREEKIGDEIFANMLPEQ